MKRPVIRISVRNLVEFVLRSGDIDNRTAGADKDAMLLGSNMHRKIQRRMGTEYKAEVSLKYVLPCKEFDLQLEGRADGVIETADGVVIDEIKGVFKNLELLKEPVSAHLSQAMCYAFIYAEQNELSEIGVQMTYCHLETEEIKRFQQVYTKDYLKEWFYEVAGQYEKWARYQIEWKEKRNKSIKGVEFPFPYREGQRELVTSAYKTILRKKKLFIQAPTGVGKTIATVFPAVRAVGEGLGEKIFYLTAKTITRTVAQQAFEVLKEQALRYKVIALTAKDKICFCEETQCNPDYCPYAKGHYDRVNDAIFELLKTSDSLSREVLEEQARKWKVCPFEMGLDVSLWADAVICDYNYVFDPNARLKRFFGEGVRGDYLFLIDEAHNLVERGRTMYSAGLCKEAVQRVKRLIKLEDAKLAERLEECNKQLLALKRECETYQVLNSAAHIYLKLLNLMGETERFLEECKKEDMRKEVLEFYFGIRMFVNIYERLDENYLVYCEMTEAGEFWLRLFCVNPAKNLKEFLDKGNATLLFSATMLPIHYYKTLLSTQTDDYAIYVDSPFAQEHRLLLIGSDVSSKYTRRDDEMYDRYARYLSIVAHARKGNYLAFFPSYTFLEQVYQAFKRLDQETEYVVQSSYMSEEAREIFLETFDEEREESLMGFCVMGGIFSEGIDLTEDKLIGAIIVGTGLPQVCRERELLKTWFDDKGMRGFDYAYLYPGMNKVMQSAGRVIRTDVDRGVILLLDDRFRDYRYQETFPREWKQHGVCRIEGAQKQMEEFWSTKQ